MHFYNNRLKLHGLVTFKIPKCLGGMPSQESLINAKTVILNFLELGLLHLNESQQVTFLSDVSHLEFGFLLEQIPSILSSS